jgi:hypothetical protein
MVVLLAAGGAGGHLTNLLVGLATVVVVVARNPATRRAVPVMVPVPAVK